MDSVGEGEGGKIWENGIETCKILKPGLENFEHYFIVRIYKELLDISKK